MKNRFKKTIIVLVMALMGTCFAAEPGQKLLGKVKTTDYVVTQECDNVFTTWLNAYDWNQYLKTESDPTVPAWAKVENPPYLTTYTETDPFFSSWIGDSTITFSNQIIKFQTDKSNFYIDGQTFGWWLNWAVAPVQTDLDTFKTSTNGKLNILTENFNDLSTRYAGSVREIERLSGNLNSFNDLISEMNRDVGGFRSDLLFFKMTLRDFQTYVTNNIESLNTSNAELTAKVDGLNTSLDDFKNETTNNIARLDSADEALGVRIDNANTALNQRIDDTNTSLDAFKTETTNAIARLDTKDSETTGNLESLSNKVVTVEGDLSYVSNKVAGVETDLDFTSNKVATVEGDLEYVSNKVVTVESGLDFTSNKTVKVESDLNNVSNKVEEIYGDYVKLSDLQAGITFDTMNVTNLTVNGEHVSLESHKHDDKLDATNGVAYGTLYVLPEAVPGGHIGDGHAILDNEGLRFTSTTMAPDITYSLNGISALFVGGNEQWYEFNNSTNGIARLKDVDSATNKLYQTMTNEFVKMEDLQEGIIFDTLNVTNLTVNGKQVALENHRHQDLETAIGGKLDSTNATFRGTLNVVKWLPENQQEYGNPTLSVDNSQVAIRGTRKPYDYTIYGIDEITQGLETYTFRQYDTNKIARLKDIPTITTNGVAVAQKNGKIEIPLNEYVKLSDLQEGININFNTMEVTNLTVNGTPVALKGHTHQLWEIPGAEAAATNAIQKINSATELRQVQDAMIEFLQIFKKPEE